MADNFLTDTVQLANANVLSGTVDPTAGAGVVAPLGSIYMRSTGLLYLKTAAGDTAWTAVPLSSGGGQWSFVEKQVIAGAAVGTVDFAAVLDGNVGKGYKVVFVSNGVASNRSYDLRINGGSIGAGASGVQLLYSDLSAPTRTAISGIRVAATQNAGTGASSHAFFECEIRQISQTAYKPYMAKGESGSAGSRAQTITSGSWQDITTNITSLGFEDSTGGATIPVGAELYLYQLTNP